MFIYSTCRDCGGLLHITDNDTVHPGCTPKPTKVERLAQEWLDAVEANDENRERELFPQIEALENRPPRLLDAALRYASWGWPVFPLAAAGYTDPKRPEFVGDGKKPYPRTRGFKDATTDADQIYAWWNTQPTSNIGLPTGLAFDVIDIDTPKKDQPIPGAIAYTELLAADLVPDIHGQVATGNGGLHLYIPATGDGNKAGIEPGIDYRGAGGYVVAPPSTLRERGRTYSWITAPSPTITAARAVA